MAGGYTHKNLEPKMVGDDYMRQLNADESQLVWLSRLRPTGSERNTVGGSAEQEPVDQEDPITNQSRIRRSNRLFPLMTL